MASQTEGNRLNDVLKWEGGIEKYHAREDVTALSGQSIPVGAVLGRISKALGTVQAGGGNTGNGTVSGASPGALAEIGEYVLTCIATAANGGTFQVKAPDGKVLPPATVAETGKTEGTPSPASTPTSPRWSRSRSRRRRSPSARA